MPFANLMPLFCYTRQSLHRTFRGEQTEQALLNLNRCKRSRRELRRVSVAEGNIRTRRSDVNVIVRGRNLSEIAWFRQLFSRASVEPT